MSQGEFQNAARQVDPPQPGMNQENALYEKSSTARAAELEMDRLQLEIKHSTHYIKVRTHKPSLAILFVLSPPPPIRLSACQQRHSYRPSPLAAARDN